jgi:hypothetical protein
MKWEIGEFNAHVNAQRKLPIKKLEIAGALSL